MSSIITGSNLFLFIWHSASILICTVILLSAAFHILFRRYVMNTMTRSAVRYSIICIILFIITQVANLNACILIEQHLSSDQINFYITNTIWTVAHIFTYLLFLNRLRNTFIRTKYKISTRTQLYFKFGILVWSIFEILMAFNQFARSANFYALTTYTYYSLILLFIIQLIDLLLSIHLISMFLHNLHKIAFDQKIRVSSVSHHDDNESLARLDILEMYDEDHVYEEIELGQMAKTSVSDTHTSGLDELEPAQSELSGTHSDYLLLSDDGNAMLRNNVLGRNEVKNQHKLLNWGVKYCLLFCVAMVSTQLALLYNLLFIVIHFWAKDHEFQASITSTSHYVWSVNMLINCYVIYLDFDFAICCYNCCCSECHRMCRICCISCARKKLVDMTYSAWGSNSSRKTHRPQMSDTWA